MDKNLDKNTKIAFIVSKKCWDLKSYQIFEKITDIKYDKQQHSFISPFIIRLWDEQKP